MRQFCNNLNSIDDSFNNIIKKINESYDIFKQLNIAMDKFNKDDILRKQIYIQMKNMFSSFQNTIKKEKDLIKIDIKENFNFFFKNFSNFLNLIKKVDEAKRIYRKEEKDLVSLKNDLYNKSKVEKLIDENVDLSKILPKNTEATLEMKKNYGYYLNRSIIEFKRMRDLDNELFKTNIIKCFKTQCDVVKTLQSEINDISSKINELRIKSEIKNEIKEKKDENKDKDKNSEENINKINVN